jgi:hypothetical protein
MAIKASELKQWLSTISDDQDVCIDDGGLTLVCCDDDSVYCEVGGFPDEGGDGE